MPRPNTFKSCRPGTHSHTQSIECSNWTTKVVGKTFLAVYTSIDEAILLRPTSCDMKTALIDIAPSTSHCEQFLRFAYVIKINPDCSDQS